MYTMLKMPIACLLLVSYSFFYYWKNKKLRTRASDIFGIIAVMVICNLVADAVTEYGVKNQNTVSVVFNDVWHVIFLTTMSSACFLMYYYVLSYIERDGVYQKKGEKRVTAIIWMLCIVGEIVLPITYVDSSHGSYASGAKIYMLYFGIAYALALILYNMARYGKVVEPTKRMVIWLSISIFAVFALLQMAFPYIMMLGLGLSMVVVGIMVTTGNPHQYYNQRTGFYNELGLHEFLRELLYWKGEFALVAYVYYGNLATEKSVGSVVAYMSEHFQTINFQLADYCIVFLPSIKGTKEMEKWDEISSLAKNCDESKEKYQIFRYDKRSTTDEIIQELYDFKKKFEKAELYYDELTGALRRGAFTQYATERLTENQGIAMLMLDVDDFKSINDNFGHFVGDKVLQEVARALKQSVRGLDIVGRMGGDEFSVLLVDIESESDVEEVIRRLNGRINRICCASGKLESVKEAEAYVDAAKRYVHVSVGGRLHLPQDGPLTFEKLYVGADNALYAAKERGKNCYEIHSGHHR